MTNSHQQEFILLRKEFWAVFFRKAGFILGGIALLGLSIGAAVYFWKLHTKPQSIDTYLPVDMTVGYMDMTFAKNTSERVGVFADAKEGRLGIIPQQLVAGSGATLLEQSLGERLGVALLQERHALLPIYFAEVANREQLEEYLNSIAPVVSSSIHPTILTLERGSSFYFTFVGKYWVVAPSSDILLVLLNRTFPVLAKDTTYLLGRGHLASRAAGKGYIHIPMLLEYVFGQEQIRPLVRDVYLLSKPVFNQLTQLVWNIEQDGAKWHVVSIVHAEKTFMEYFRQVMKVQSGQPVWHGKTMSFALDTARLDDWRVSIRNYLQEANDPLVIILRSYLEESTRVLGNGVFADGFPTLGYGAVLSYIDPVTLRPTLGIYANFDPVDKSFLAAWMEGLAPVLLDMLSDRRESMTRRMQSIGDYEVVMFSRGGIDVYTAISTEGLLLSWGNGSIIEEWLGEEAITDAKYPLVRTSSFTLDMEPIQRLWNEDFTPMTSTGSLLYSMDNVYGGLRTFEDGARFEFTIEMK